MSKLSKKIESSIIAELKKSNASPEDGVTEVSQAYAEFLIHVGMALKNKDPRAFARDIVMQLASQI